MRWYFTALAALAVMLLVVAGIWVTGEFTRSAPPVAPATTPAAAQPASPAPAPSDNEVAAPAAGVDVEPEANAETEEQARAETAGETVLDGTDGDDTLVGTDGPDRITGGPGNDTTSGMGGNDRLYAASESDAQGADTVSGGEGDDRIYADAGDDISGGPGHDQLIVRGDAGFVIDLAASEIEEPWGGPGPDVFDGSAVVGIDLAIRGGGGDDVLTGGTGNDRLYGGDGDDTLIGGPGNDLLRGEAGTDALTGGPGSDSFVVDGFDGSTDIIIDYSAEDGDIVSGASFLVVDDDTLVLDADRNPLFRLIDYDGSVSGIKGR